MPRAKTGQVRGKPRGIRHDRDCSNCKTRGVKCDLNRPRCLPCVQAELACGGWPQRVVWTSGSTSSTDKQFSNISNGVQRRRMALRRQEPLSPSDGSMSVISFAPHPLSAESERDDGAPTSFHAQRGPSHTPDEPTMPPAEQYGLAQRLLTFCRNAKRADDSLSTTAEGDNHTVSVDRVTRLVSRIDEFLQARMKTYASTSFAPLPPTPSSLDGRQPSPPLLLPPPPRRQDDGEASELHRLAALASLSEALDTADPVAFVGIAVFAFFEVVSDAAFGEWQTHLRGARSLLDYHCRSREELDSLSRRVNGLSEILGYFAWWDVIGINIRRLSGRHSSQDDEPIFLDWHRGVVGDEFFGTVGCPPDTFQVFALLADTSSLREKDASSPQVELDTYVQAMGQLLRLGSDSTDQGKCSDAWRCAAAVAVLTWQQQSVDGRDKTTQGPRQATLDAAVDRICELIASASPASRFYIHMATAAFFAGINTRFVRHCEVLRGYWKGCRIGEHPRYWGAYTECEERWRRKELT
ncbi:unnamed protein product [Clonostachys chloroleuca]|uniref:Zn(2)-C6 fungal-type domain-containing protein n=1 Tax=Clonostachys chloroleuca TaxID=1926264 RepID=A0AA35MAL5_9HYPO|nr:unnamed protein product [Clonostachys chloroleuca]